jgi:hypothetical protein
VIVWVVTQKMNEGCPLGELGGIFTTEEKALAVCTDPDDCLFPITLDEFLGRESVEIPGCVYPVTEASRPDEGGE